LLLVSAGAYLLASLVVGFFVAFGAAG